MKIYINRGTSLTALDNFYKEHKSYTTEYTLYISPIYYGYLSRELYTSLSDELIEMLKQEQYYIIFLKRRYWLVLKSDCLVEKY